MNPFGLKCFEENRNLFSDPEKEPEKFNLYQGLTALAHDCLSMGSNVDQILLELRQLRREVAEVKRSQGLA